MPGSIGAVMALTPGQSPRSVVAATCPNGLIIEGPNLYFTDWCDKTINVVPKVGGSARQLAAAEGLPDSIASDGSYVYWANFDQSIRRVAVEGGASEQVAPFAATQLALDGQRLYAVSFDDVLVEISLSDFGLRTMSPELAGAAALSMRLDQADVYVADENVRRLWRVAKDVPDARAEIIPTYDQLNGIAVDQESVYWTGVNGYVVRQPKAGGPAEELVGRGNRSPWWIGVDAQYIYWEIRASSVYTADASFQRLGKPTHASSSP